MNLETPLTARIREKIFGCKSIAHHDTTDLCDEIERLTASLTAIRAFVMPPMPNGAWHDLTDETKARFYDRLREHMHPRPEK